MDFMSYELLKRLALYEEAGRELSRVARRSAEAQRAVEELAPFKTGDRVEYRGRSIEVRFCWLSHNDYQLADEDRNPDCDLCWEIFGANRDERLVVPITWGTNHDRQAD